MTSSLSDYVDTQSYSPIYFSPYSQYWSTFTLTENGTYSNWSDSTDGSHSGSLVTESTSTTQSGAEVGGGFATGGVSGLTEDSTDLSLLYWITSEQFNWYPTSHFVLYRSPRTVAAYLSSPPGNLVAAGLGDVMFQSPFGLACGFIPSTDAMTAHGLPSEKAATFNNLALNKGPTDGVSQTATAPPTSVLITLAAAGRNPTDILIPTQAGSEGSSGEDNEDQAPAPGAPESNAAAGTSEPEPADDEEGGSHLTREQVTILLANGYALDNIIKADAALAEGASPEVFELLLGARPQAKRPGRFQPSLPIRTRASPKPRMSWRQRPRGSWSPENKSFWVSLPKNRTFSALADRSRWD